MPFVGVDGHTFSRYTEKRVAKPFTGVWGPRMFALSTNRLRSNVGSVQASGQTGIMALMLERNLIDSLEEGASQGSGQ